MGLQGEKAPIICMKSGEWSSTCCVLKVGRRRLSSGCWREPVSAERSEERAEWRAWAWWAGHGRHVVQPFLSPGKVFVCALFQLWSHRCRMFRSVWNAAWDPYSKGFLRVMLKNLAFILQLMRSCWWWSSRIASQWGVWNINTTLYDSLNDHRLAGQASAMC